MPASPEVRYVRTTVKVREDLHQKAKRRGVDLSEALNATLERELGRPKGKRHTLRGSLKGLLTRADWEENHRQSEHTW